jgi:glucosamine-6-phosphate deaminase
MEILILPDAEQAARKIAEIIAEAMERKPDLVLGLATGRTMEKVYEHLVAFHRQDGLDFSRCSSFNLDEYVGLAPDDERSYRRYMDQHLFDHVNICRGAIHVPDGNAANRAEECREYEAEIARLGGIDLQLLGLGSDGHIGFNEPMSGLYSRTRVTSLAAVTRSQNAEMFGGDPACVPERAITMGVGTILQARQCLLLATGSSKAGILARAVEGPITAMVTASALQLHPDCKIVLDLEAASRLQGEHIST